MPLEELKNKVNKWFVGFDLNIKIENTVNECEICNTKSKKEEKVEINKKLAFKILGPFSKGEKKLKFLLVIINCDDQRIELNLLKKNDIKEYYSILLNRTDKNKDKNWTILTDNDNLQNLKWKKFLKKYGYSSEQLSDNLTRYYNLIDMILREVEEDLLWNNVTKNIERILNQIETSKPRIDNNNKINTKMKKDNYPSTLILPTAKIKPLNQT